MLEKGPNLPQGTIRAGLNRLMLGIETEPRDPYDIPARQVASDLNIWLGKEEKYSESTTQRFTADHVPDDATPEKILGHATQKYVSSRVTDNYVLGISNQFFYHSKRDKVMKFDIVAIPKKKAQRPIKTEE